VGAPQWGKYWLSILNLYEWEGVNPVPPELWYVAPHSQQLFETDICLGFCLTGCRSIPGDGGYNAALSICQHRISIPTSVKCHSIHY
jgi:hypothetical protein